MANHKKKCSKNQRSGCLMCKPWKINGFSINRPGGESISARKGRFSASEAIESFYEQKEQY